MAFWKGLLGFLFIVLVLLLLGTYWMGFMSPQGIEISQKNEQGSNFSLNEGKNISQKEPGNEEEKEIIENTNLSKNTSRTEADFFASELEEFMFYENLRFKDEKISYKISNECTLGKKEDALNAFNKIQNMTTLEFFETSSEPEILIACQSTKEPKGNMFVAGEGGPVNITKSGKFNVIHYGEVLLIEESEKSCPKPNVAVHEILHALGFKHSSNENNIMYETSKCEQKIGEDIPRIIEGIYEQPAKPDIVLEDVKTNTHGRYIDFNASIRNQGLSDSEEFSLGVYKDDELLKENEVDGLRIGFGTKILSKNINFGMGDFKELRFEIETDYKELSKENNKIIFEKE